MINRLKFILNNCWDAETCYTNFKEFWNINNKTLGQCAVTALIVNDYLRGTIRRCNAQKELHYFNFNKCLSSD